jgi:hypothetical protein
LKPQSKQGIKKLKKGRCDVKIKDAGQNFNCEQLPKIIFGENTGADDSKLPDAYSPKTVLMQRRVLNARQEMVKTAWSSGGYGFFFF